jgi:coenzyme F420-reducing hydrogenase alpha subunit
MTSTSVSQGLLEEIAQRLEQAKATAQQRVERFDRLDLDEESEASMRDLAVGLRNDLHHIQGLLEEVLTSEVPALRGQLP